MANAQQWFVSVFDAQAFLALVKTGSKSDAANVVKEYTRQRAKARQESAERRLRKMTHEEIIVEALPAASKVSLTDDDARLGAYLANTLGWKPIPGTPGSQVSHVLLRLDEASGLLDELQAIGHGRLNERVLQDIANEETVEVQNARLPLEWFSRAGSQKKALDRIKKLIKNPPRGAAKVLLVFDEA